MADETRPIFTKQAAEKLRSPDDLEKYVRVTNPSVWVILAACAAVLVGLLAWGIFGAVTTNVETTGACINGQALCYLSPDDATKVTTGEAALVDGKQLKVASVADIPSSPSESQKILESDYLVSALVKEEWAYLITFEGDTSGIAEGVPVPVTITIERVAPISLISGRK